MPKGIRKKDGSKLGFQKGIHPKTEFKKGNPKSPNAYSWKKGNIPWNKNKFGYKIKPPSEETKKRLRKWGRKFGFQKGYTPYNKGKKVLNRKSPPTFTDTHRENLSLSLKGKKCPNKSKPGEKNPFYGHKHTEKTKEEIRLKKTGKPCIWTEDGRRSFHEKMSGENSPHWIKDRSLLKKDNKRNDVAYGEWRKQVWKRDGWKCRINNKDCRGKIIVHHILSWRDFPELRYNINNGITLCQAHHPRKRAEEKRLIPAFQELVSVSSE